MSRVWSGKVTKIVTITILLITKEKVCLMLQQPCVMLQQVTVQI